MVSYKNLGVSNENQGSLKDLVVSYENLRGLYENQGSLKNLVVSYEHLWYVFYENQGCLIKIWWSPMNICATSLVSEENLGSLMKILESPMIFEVLFKTKNA